MYNYLYYCVTCDNCPYLFVNILENSLFVLAPRIELGLQEWKSWGLTVSRYEHYLCGKRGTRTPELRREQIYSLRQLPLCDLPNFTEREIELSLRFSLVSLYFCSNYGMDVSSPTKHSYYCGNVTSTHPFNIKSKWVKTKIILRDISKHVSFLFNLWTVSDSNRKSSVQGRCVSQLHHTAPI